MSVRETHTEPGPAPQMASTRPSLMSPSNPGDTPTIRTKPNNDFFWMHHRDSWEVATVDGAPTLLPGFAPKYRVPGAGNIRTIPKGQSESHAWQHSLGLDMSEGWVWLSPTDPIPEEFCPPGVDGSGGYIKRYDCVNPKTGVRGTCHRLIWNMPQRSAPGSPTRWAMHYESYNRWRKWLVETGVIERPAEYILGDKIAIAEERRNRAVNLTGLGDEARKERISKATEDLNSVQAAVVPGEDIEPEVPAMVSTSKRSGSARRKKTAQEEQEATDG